MPFGVFGWRWEILCSTCFATTFLHIRSRLARSRPSTHASCRWHSISRSKNYRAAKCGATQPGSDPRCRDCRGNTTACRFMDAHRGSTCGGHRALARLLATWRSVELYHAGNPRCRPGTARTWRLVGGCATFWMETHRHSRLRELSLTPLLGYSSHTSKGHSSVPIWCTRRLHLGLSADVTRSRVRAMNKRIQQQ